MTWLLDTVTVSELRKPHADGHVLDWVANEDVLDLFISSITVLELEIGVRRKERTDPRQGAALRAWLDHSVLPAFANRILAFDSAAAVAAAALHVPDPRPERDTMIAGIAIAHSLTIVTRNTRDFATTGVACVDPWLAP